jgi:hypothetical protein
MMNTSGRYVNVSTPGIDIENLKNTLVLNVGRNILTLIGLGYVKAVREVTTM